MNKLYAWFKRKASSLQSLSTLRLVISSVGILYYVVVLGVQVTDPFWSYLKQGATPIKLSRSAAVGFSIGICPLIGADTLLYHVYRDHLC